MAVLDPQHLLEQAERLIQPPSSGPPRQVDIRRAISSAYYAAFHALLTAASDEIVGVTERRSGEYYIVYRSISHRWIRELSLEVAKQQPGRRIGRHSPAGGFGGELRALAILLPDLQEARHVADYDPAVRLNTADAITAASKSRDAIAHLEAADAGARKRFLTLLAFPPSNA